MTKRSKRLTRSTQEGLHSMEEIVRDAVLQVPPFLCTVAQTRTLFGRPPWVEPCSSKLRDSFSSRGFTLDLPERSVKEGKGGEEREKGGEGRRGEEREKGGEERR